MSIFIQPIVHLILIIPVIGDWWPDSFILQQLVNTFALPHSSWANSFLEQVCCISKLYIWFCGIWKDALAKAFYFPGLHLFNFWDTAMPIGGMLRCSEIYECLVSLSWWFPHLPKIQEVDDSHIAKPSSKSEYHALACAICKLQWLIWYSTNI
jgi:hypothetical protein